MHIRTATENDLSAIVDLLKKSLGESMIPKSEGLWKWKHESNPFGQSYVILAEEDNQLIGVRAFMKWNWSWKEQTYRAIRAVDTATHPDHQGKGIFKKLTLKQLELCEEDGVDFVFNTPNDQSRPGYLKMGWQQQGKMPLKLKVTTLIELAMQVAFKKAPKAANSIQFEAKQWKPILDLCENKTPLPIPGLHTIISAAYINWRYAVNPLFNYGFISDNENYLLTYRMKDHPKYRELRITDFILFKDHVTIASDIRKKMRIASSDYGANVITMSGNQHQFFKKYFHWMGIIPVKPLGPIVTVRAVKKETDMNLLIDTKNWQYSLGDMELF